MTTTGQRTTTPMSARAGLSHSNGARRRRAAGIEIFLFEGGAARDPAGGTPGPARRSISRTISASRRGGDLLQLRQFRHRAAGDRETDRLLDLGLHGRPGGVARVL